MKSSLIVLSQSCHTRVRKDEDAGQGQPLGLVVGRTRECFRGRARLEWNQLAFATGRWRQTPGPSPLISWSLSWRLCRQKRTRNRKWLVSTLTVCHRPEEQNFLLSWNVIKGHMAKLPHNSSPSSLEPRVFWVEQKSNPWLLQEGKFEKNSVHGGCDAGATPLSWWSGCR